MNKFLMIILCALCFYSVGQAQEKAEKENIEKERAPIGLSGFVGAAFSNKAQYITFGGPGLKLMHSDLRLYAGFFPSLRIENQEARPSLGVGFQVMYKWAVLTLPSFYYAQNDWELAIGGGVVFPLKIKKK